MCVCLRQKKLPIGIDNFEELRKEGFYYIDKTMLIKELLLNWSEVSLFTRPRRFGKTLNISMLKSFFELGMEPQLFEGLAISREEELCEKYRGKFPVIFLSLKGVDGLDFDTAYQMLCRLIRAEISRLIRRYESDSLKEELEGVGRMVDSGQMGGVMDGLRLLSEVFEKHLKKKTVILIDEYDVPLDKAYQHGYYDRMVSLIRGLLLDTLYCVWQEVPVGERPDRLYEIILNSWIKNLRMEDLMQHGGELQDFDEFLDLWIDYLGRQSGSMAEKLFEEAIALTGDLEKAAGVCHERDV